MNNKQKQKCKELKQSLTRLSDEMARISLKIPIKEDPDYVLIKRNSIKKKTNNNVLNPIQDNTNQHIIINNEHKKPLRTSTFLKPSTEIPKLPLNNLEKILKNNIKEQIETITTTQIEPNTTTQKELKPSTFKELTSILPKSLILITQKNTTTINTQKEQVNKQSTHEAFSSNEDSLSSLRNYTQDDFSDSNRDYKRTFNKNQQSTIRIYEKDKLHKIYHNMKLTRIINQKIEKEKEECKKKPTINPKSTSILNKKGYNYIPLYQRSNDIINKRNTHLYFKKRMIEKRERHKELSECIQHNKVNYSQTDIDNFIDFQFRWKEKVDFEIKLNSILKNASFLEESNSIKDTKKKINCSQEECNTKLYLDFEKRKERQKEIEDKYTFSFKPSINSFNPRKFKQKTETCSNISTKTQISTYNFNKNDSSQLQLKKSTDINPHYAIQKNPIKYYKANHKQINDSIPFNSHTKNHFEALSIRTKSNKLNQSWDSKSSKCFDKYKEAQEVVEEYTDKNIKETVVNYKESSWRNELRKNINQSSSSINSNNEKDYLYKKLYKLNASTTSSNGKNKNKDIVATQKTFQMLLK